MDIDQALNLEELRSRWLVHSRQAYRLMPALERPRILDIGCGRGVQTMEWFEGVRKQLPETGFELTERHMLPKHYWWTEYGAPLEERIREFRKARGDAADPPELAEHVNAVAAIKKDPDRTDCEFYLARKRA